MGYLTNVIRNILLRDQAFLKDVFEAYSRNRLSELSSQVKLGQDSKFHEPSKVFNFLGDRSKILIGSFTHLRAELLLFRSGGSIRIGDYCYLGEGTRIWSADEIVIGNNVLISHNCNIIDTDSHELNYVERAEGYRMLLERGHAPEKGNVKTAPIHISDNAWLSYNVSILKGVTIGKGAIIAAGSVVTKDVPDFSIMAGNPATQVNKNVEIE